MAIPSLKAIIGIDSTPLTKSLGQLKNDLKTFKTQLDDATDPKNVARLNKSLIDTQNQIKGIEKYANQSGSSLKSLMSGLATGAGIEIWQRLTGFVSDFFNGAIKEAEEAQRAVNNLKQTLAGAGRGDLAAGLLKTADELQEKFSYLDNDDITAGFTKLIQFGGLTEKQLRELMPVIIDLNAKQRLAGEANKSVADSADDLVKGLAGQGRELKKYGVEISNTMPLQQRINTLLGTFKDKVNGAADAYSNSLEGSVQKVNQQLRDQQEILGNNLLPMKVAVLNMINSFADKWQEWTQKLEGTYDAVQKAKSAMDELSKMKSDAADLAGSFNNKADNAALEGYIKFYNKMGDALAGAIVKDPKNEALRSKLADYNAKVEAFQKQIQLNNDTRTIGKHTETSGDGTDKVLEQLQKQLDLKKELIKAYPDEIRYLKESSELETKIAFRQAKYSGLSSDVADDIARGKEAEYLALIDKLQKRLDAVAKLHPLTLNIDNISNQENIASNILGGKGDKIGKTGADSNMFKGIVERAEIDGEDARKRVVNITKILNSELGNAGESFGQSIAAAFSPGADVKSITAPILNLLAEVVETIGKAILEAGITMEGAQKAIKALWANPVVAIAAGVGLIALGEILKASLNKASNNAVKRFAEGGVVTGPTNALIGESGKAEAVLPFEKIPWLLDKVGGGSGGYIADARFDMEEMVIRFEPIRNSLIRRGRL